MKSMSANIDTRGAWLPSLRVWNWPCDWREFSSITSLGGMKVTASLFLNESGWSHGHGSRSQLSPAHLWQRVHLEGLAGNGSGRAGQMLQIREEICSWVALGKLVVALAVGGGEKGRKVQRKRSLPWVIL